MFKVAFNFQELVAALKSSSLANAPALIKDVVGVLFGWVSASLALMVATNPIFSFFVGLVPSIVAYIEDGLQQKFPQLTITIKAMTLTKAWDVQALVNALKSAGLSDAEAFVQSDVDTAFQWVNYGLSQGNSVEKLLAPLVLELGSLVDDAIVKFFPQPAAAPVVAAQVKA